MFACVGLLQIYLAGEATTKLGEILKHALQNVLFGDGFKIQTTSSSGTVVDLRNSKIGFHCLNGKEIL